MLPRGGLEAGEEDSTEEAEKTKMKEASKRDNNKGIYCFFGSNICCLAVGHSFHRLNVFDVDVFGFFVKFTFRTLNIWILRKYYLTTLRGKNNINEYQ